MKLFSTLQAHARPRPGRAAYLAAAIALGCWLLAGCGQSGPLYLPTQPQAQERASLGDALLPAVLQTSTP